MDLESYSLAAFTFSSFLSGLFFSNLSHTVDLSMIDRTTMLLAMMTKSWMVFMIYMGS